MIAPPPAGAQTAPGQKVRAAMQQIGRGEVDEGIASLRAVTEEHPDFVQGWSALGNVLNRSQRYGEALEAYSKAIEIGGETGALMMQVGLVHAGMGHPDAAFEWLMRAKAAGTVDITTVDRIPAAASLRDDPRFAELMPSTDEFSNPFVEDARILREWAGEGRADVFGWIARNAGDVDGDGIDDVVTSSKGIVETGSQNGKIYVYSSGTGELLWSFTGTDEGGQLGFGVETAGDVNADGIPDVVAGAPYADKVLVFHGRTGEVLREFSAGDPTSAFGISVKGIGDLDGDGHSDILVGAPGQIWGNPINGGSADQTGFATVFSGRDGSVVLRLAGGAPGDGFGSNVAGRTVGGETWFIVGAPNAGDRREGRSYVYRGLTSMPRFTVAPDEGGQELGQMFQSVVGDVDGDGVPDMYLSDWADDGAAQNAGKIYVISGADGSRIFTHSGEAAGDGFGIGISDAGDVDGDGHADLIVGAWQHASAAASGGKLYLISGADGEVVRTVTGNVPGETLGFDTTNVGDVDGDGANDFLVTSAYSAINGWHAGRVLIISGAE